MALTGVLAGVLSVVTTPRVVMHVNKARNSTDIISVQRAPGESMVMICDEQIGTIFSKIASRMLRFTCRA